MLCRFLLAALCLAAPSSGVVNPISGVAGINAAVAANSAAGGKLLVVLFETNLCSMYSSKVLQALTALSTSSVSDLVEVRRCDVTGDSAVISTFDIGGVPTIKLWWQGRGPASYTGGRSAEELQEMVRLSQGPSVKAPAAAELDDDAGTLKGTKSDRYLGSYVIGIPKGLLNFRPANIEMVAHNRRNRAIFVTIDSLTGTKIRVYGRDLKMIDGPVEEEIANNDITADPTGTATAIGTMSKFVDDNTYEPVADMSTIAYSRLLERDLVICWAFLDPENPGAFPNAKDRELKKYIDAEIGAFKGRVAVIRADGRFWHHKALEMIPGLAAESNARNLLPAMACEYNGAYTALTIAQLKLFPMFTQAEVAALFTAGQGLNP
eukprot:Rhum_TRINITY_DN14516_c23_g1::Rhum_TRINITY_DN14516_c23_g1_i1::g.94646::m.94646